MTAVVTYPVKKVANLEELVVELNSEFNPTEDIWTQLERENPDFSFYQDVNFDSLIETLTYNGLTEDQITTFALALYGPVIDFYQVGSGDVVLFVMAIGQR